MASPSLPVRRRRRTHRHAGNGRAPAHVRKWLGLLGASFWPVPGLLTPFGILAAVGLVALDRSTLVPKWILESDRVCNGGGSGARTLLGAVAGSTIGVVGTVFPITVAALSLAAAQMGPWRMRSCTRDRGVHLMMGIDLGTASRHRLDRHR